MPFLSYNTMVFYPGRLMKKTVLSFPVLVALLFLFQHSMGQGAFIYHGKLKWNNPYKDEIGRLLLSFEGGSSDPRRYFLPVFTERFAGRQNLILSNERYEALSSSESAAIDAGINIGQAIEMVSREGFEKKKQYTVVSFIPLRYNRAGNIYEKLVAFDLILSPGEEKEYAKKAGGFGGQFTSSSVLKSGRWFKVATVKDGVYRLTYQDLLKLGMDSVINAKNIRMYGNGGEMLSNFNGAPRYDDLLENAIFVSGENDGVFDESDYILFFGRSPNRWKYNASDGRFHHTTHLYSDTVYYFITADIGAGKRIALEPPPASYNTTVTAFDDFAYHDEDKRNILKTGREWYGEEFDVLTTQDFIFSFPAIDFSVPVYFKCETAARSCTPSSFSVRANGQNVLTQNIGNIDCSCYFCDYAASSSASGSTATFTPSSPDITISLSYNKPASTSVGWLNYLEINARSKLIMNGGQLLFRDAKSSGAGNISMFEILGSAPDLRVFDVTDPVTVKEEQLAFNGSQASFVLATDTLHEFIAFSSGSYLDPVLDGAVENQDLHALPQPDLIIVTAPEFKDEAMRLADFHRQSDSLGVVVVTPQQVYNEFSSGSRDISAIRDFVRMFYNRAATPAEMPGYLLLFGDGSYDNKDRLAVNNNFIPTYQSANSLAPILSYVSDDYYGLLDSNEGQWNSNSAEFLDIGIGRLPVKTAEEAKGVVDKIIRYGSPATASGGLCDASAVSSFGDWRNTICFVADDEDNNTHISQAESLANYVDTSCNNYNIDKIYFDAYKQQSTPGGQRYPDVNEAIDKRVERGALIINYTGHGGEAGLAHERVLDITSINSWENINNLPLFFTATCEFSRFDDPDYTSAGEYVLLNPNGGGIALMSTVRLVQSGPNYTLNQRFYQNLFSKKNGAYEPIGEIFRNTKVASGTIDNNRNFTLLGDPALRLAMPRYNIITTAVNGDTVLSAADTIRALDKITIAGEIRDAGGARLNEFNGILTPTVYDKSTAVTTLANDPSSSPFAFRLQKNIVYRGKVSVKNGKFTFTFIVPKDIAFQYGQGRVSYYAENGSADANGFYENVQIGGAGNGNYTDKSGPVIRLYLNDEKFVPGMITDDSPSLYALLSDSSGINTVGNGIGHDLVATLDEANEGGKIYELNDYYESDLDSYRSGKVIYPFSKLNEGRHKIAFKAWDVYNNSSYAVTEFVVASSEKMALEHVLNYPNPFTTHTAFYFNHNRPCIPMDVRIQVFTVSGKIIKTINASMDTKGYRSDPVEWDGLDDFGEKIGRGVYIYRVEVRSGDGSYADKYEKLVILK